MAAAPASISCHSTSTPAAATTSIVTALISGPMPSPGIKVIGYFTWPSPSSSDTADNLLFHRAARLSRNAPHAIIGGPTTECGVRNAECGVRSGDAAEVGRVQDDGIPHT